MKKEEKNNDKNKKHGIGSLGSMIDITGDLFSRLRKFSIKEAIKNSKREDHIAAALSVIIIVILGIILWFIPATRGFIRDMIPF
ncbi:MAG: hypothetical protein HUJ68_02830 [Clostridia bacterium]|nr:hypothetical protein [Clostridia bacterium]